MATNGMQGQNLTRDGQERARKEMDALIDAQQKKMQPFYKSQMQRPADVDKGSVAHVSNPDSESARSALPQAEGPSDKHGQPRPAPKEGKTLLRDSRKSTSNPLDGWGARKEPQLNNNAGTGRPRTSSSTSGGQASAQQSATRPSVIPTATKRPYDGLVAVRKSKSARSDSLTSPRSPSKAGGRSPQSDRTPPNWYNKIKPAQGRRSDSQGTDVALQRLKDDITKAKAQKSNIDPLANSVRDRLHKLAFLQVNENMLRNRRMLHNNDGLPQIFDERYSGGVEWPYDVRADAEELYNKWFGRIFETNLLRGIVAGKPKGAMEKGSSDRLDKTWPGLTSANYHGNGKLVNGQWWPTQLCALRDGAHGHSIRGISGHLDDGAYSIVMSNGYQGEAGHSDEDAGDRVLYCGTDGSNGKVSDDTQIMLNSVGGEPVRVIRSHNCPSKFAPELGFRYDGLYDVVKATNLDGPSSSRQRHRFTLVRRPDQDAMRGEYLAKRPTFEEMEAYKQDKRLRGF